MRPFHDRRSKIVMSFATLWLFAPGIMWADPNDALARRLTRIRADSRAASVDKAALESRCLELLADYNTPSQRGKIYAAVAAAYSERGFGVSTDRATSIAKTIEFATKALDCPLDVPTACHMYGRMTDALIASGKEAPADKWPQIRRAAIVPCLKGLKLALDNKAPRERPQSPPKVTVPNIIRIGGTQTDQERRRRYEEQLEARRQYDRMEELYSQRRVLTQLCAALYARPPYDSDEFRTYAQQILVGQDEGLSEIIRCVNEQIELMKNPPRVPSDEPRQEGSS